LAWIAAITLLAAVGSTVNPWPRDGWYQTQYFLAGHFLDWDNYTPIAAPALLYACAHGIAQIFHLDLAGEFYVASALQNLLLALSAYFVYRTLVLLRLPRLALPLALLVLLCVLSTGLAQAFYSEGVCLFLMSAALLALIPVYEDANLAARKFWILAVSCGVSIALLVLTRLTPGLLIPAIALLLFRRVPLRRNLQFTGTLTAITVLAIALTIVGNHARFGRYELTNSSGRHLWQGIKDFSDGPLKNSWDYQVLKRVEPNLQGKNWWDVPPDPHNSWADPREAMLQKLSHEAIRNAPLTYLAHGAAKFVKTIGVMPYRLGYESIGHLWDPLHRTEPLPALTDVAGIPKTYSNAVDGATRALHAGFAWLYPVTIFTIALFSLSLVTEFLGRFILRRKTRDNGKVALMLTAVFTAVGVALAAIPLAASGFTAGALTGSAACLLLLAVCAPLLHAHLSRGERSSLESDAAVLYCFSAILFFGTLWFTWQVEFNNSRNVLPYLPLWAVMLGLAVHSQARAILNLRVRAGPLTYAAE
jgi:hypothetical protein